ncbi:GrpB family protein [Croceicoccus sp. BE223]|uniref:GrpB family protein n=1 Tax=Croceicoccus sp. BE223 TaxID=2817716 RepID=UPI00285B0E49|nr:GrpB family protein [Croceicoccus sp. BE223]MDR7101869.1 GrpB-like predicted nucleotidyltransferase (UPF0157 family) [Croceicoccus sp. BE223]
MGERFLLAADADRARRRADAAFADLVPGLRAALPAGAEFHHVGATSIPGCLTKGDLDVNVRLPAADFDAAERALAARFDRNVGTVRTADFASFEDDDRDPPLGIQLTAFGSAYDFFLEFHRALRADPAAVDAYNALKRRHDGGDMDAYREEKSRFVRELIDWREGGSEG